MEEVKHIKSINIQNFKCFDNFSAEGFGMYNIILGDNNVGKTSFLESLLFDENVSQTIGNFQASLYHKNILEISRAFTTNPFIFFINRYSGKNFISIRLETSQTNLNLKIEPVLTKDINIEDRSTFSQYFNNNNNDQELLLVNKNGTKSFRKFDVTQNFESTTNFSNLVYSAAFYMNDLVEYYSKFYTESREAKRLLINSLRAIIKDIVDIEINLNFDTRQPIIGIWLENKDALLPLPMFGDGTVRLFRMIMEITMCKNEYLSIDEIDTGIHYSRYKDFSRIVLQTAKANSVQLFISTHNNEFLKSFKEVLEEKDFAIYQDDTKCFTLKKLPDESIKAYKYDFEEFEFAIEQENELR